MATAGSMDLEGVERLVAEVGPFHEEQSLRNFAEPESGSLEAGFFPSATRHTPMPGQRVLRRAFPR